MGCWEHHFMGVSNGCGVVVSSCQHSNKKSQNHNNKHYKPMQSQRQPGKKGRREIVESKKARKLSLINFTSKPEISSRFMPNIHHINCALSYCNWHILFVAIKIFMVAASFAVIAMRHAIKTTLPYNFSANYLVGGNKRLFQELW